MIRGRVSAALEAIIPIEVFGQDRRPLTIDAVIDTGFNDYLALLPLQVKALSLTEQAYLKATLGDGSIVTLPVYSATIRWEGGERRIDVLASSGGPLLGTALLRGHRVTIDMVEDGAILIEALPLSETE